MAEIMFRLNDVGMVCGSRLMSSVLSIDMFAYFHAKLRAWFDMHKSVIEARVLAPVDRRIHTYENPGRHADVGFADAQSLHPLDTNPGIRPGEPEPTCWASRAPRPTSTSPLKPGPAHN